MTGILLLFFYTGQLQCQSQEAADPNDQRQRARYKEGLVAWSTARGATKMLVQWAWGTAMVVMRGTARLPYIIRAAGRISRKRGHCGAR
jgi:hypothetical protein